MVVVLSPRALSLLIGTSVRMGGMSLIVLTTVVFPAPMLPVTMSLMSFTSGRTSTGRGCS